MLRMAPQNYGLRPGSCGRAITNACTISKFTDNNKEQGASPFKTCWEPTTRKCELYGENSGTWSVVDKEHQNCRVDRLYSVQGAVPGVRPSVAPMTATPYALYCNKKLYTRNYRPEHRQRDQELPTSRKTVRWKTAM